MYAGHIAAGLAIKGYTAKAPTWALLTGVFVPDFLWIAFARMSIEPTRPDAFFDDWSHSLLMVVIWAALFAALFWRLGRTVMLAAWLAVFSHFLLDAPIHPKYLALYPHSSFHIGVVASHGQFALRNWFVECLVVLILSFVYARRAHRCGLRGNLIAATLVLAAGLQLLTLL
jgi:hypothetical protein